MLRSLTIRGFALFEDVRVEFGPGLNVVTGETGAGKSLLVNAIGFLLGDRADTSHMRAGVAEASVEGIFEIPQGRARDEVARLIEEKTGSRPEEGQVALSRTLDTSGRSRAFVCNRFLTREALREVAGNLVTVHGQKEHSTLVRPSTQRDKLDTFAGLDIPLALRARFAEKRAGAAATFRELAELRRAERDRLDRLDLLRFQAGEIKSAEIKVGELSQLKDEFQTLFNAERIRAKLTQQLESLHESDASVLERLSTARRAFQELAPVASALGPIAARIEEARLILDDAVTEARRYGETLEADPGRLAEVTERLDRVNRILDRFKVDEAAALALLADMELEISKLSGAERRGEMLESELQAALDEMFVIGCKLTAARAASAPKLAAAVHEALAGLEMERAMFRIVLKEIAAPRPALSEAELQQAGDVNLTNRNHALAEPDSLARSNSAGFDEVIFEIAPNPGEPSRPMGDIASGGELARIALAVESACAERVSTPIILFDEIDENVGGRLGSALGVHLRKVAAPRQVLLVTHLAGVAAHADRHLFVSKLVKGGRTQTQVSALGADERISELAAMMTGDSKSAAARADARAVLEAANPEVFVILQNGAAETSRNGKAENDVILKPKSKNSAKAKNSKPARAKIDRT